MRCPVCGLELMLYEVQKTQSGGQERIYTCRNPRCERFDARLKKRKQSVEQQNG